jgi:hypothetical protein
MTIAEIMEFAETQMARKEKIPHVFRDDSWYEDQIRFRRLWLQACTANSLERIAKHLEDGQLSILEAENISNHVKLIADRIPG